MDLNIVIVIVNPILILGPPVSKDLSLHAVEASHRVSAPVGCPLICFQPSITKSEITYPLQLEHTSYLANRDQSTPSKYLTVYPFIFIFFSYSGIYRRRICLSHLG
ncbi:hypothetical protein BJX76DRAFT_325051 [Aspergillus varians]